ncbi:MAG: hypothetical protein WBG92_09160 [Thiohalocapsa sp.]
MSMAAPVRSGMGADPADYPWSSYRVNALGESNALLAPHPLYSSLGRDELSRRTAYRDLFGSALAEAPLEALRMALKQDQPIGNERFFVEIEMMTGQRRILRKRGRPRKPREDDAKAEEGQRQLYR